MDPRRGSHRRAQRLTAIVLFFGPLFPGAALQPARATPPSHAPAEPSATHFAGRPLEAALRELRAEGLRLIYTSRVVRPDLRVEREPAGGAPRAILEELLAAHGLTSRQGPNGLLIIVPRPPSPPAPATGRPESDEPATTFHEEIVVTPSQFSLLGAGPSSRLGLSREEILSLPHLGDDLARALAVVPGVATGDVSARFHLRGGRRDETEFVLDGQELLDPFHLRDFDGALSFVPPAILSDATLASGAFSARFGGRMSGVLEMNSAAPSPPVHGRIGLGILGAQVGGGGPLPRHRGSWIAEARRGSGDLLGRLLKIENPEYWDTFGKVELNLDERQSLRANLLLSTDRLSFREVRDGEPKRWLTDYDDSYLWLTHQALLGSALLVESAASSTRLHRDRGGSDRDEDARFVIRDRRDTDIREARQGWSLQTGRHEIHAGWQLRDGETEYDYRGTRQQQNPLAQLRHDFGRESTVFASRFAARDRAFYLSDTMRLLKLFSLELGLRYDQTPLTGEAAWSPRLNLAYALNERTVWRFGWGLFHQSQRTSELQIEDGETSFHRSERAEHRVLGVERSIPGAGRLSRLNLRLELYQRTVDHPRPRYENLFEPLNVFPEIEPDRVRTTPSSSRARGVEMFLRGAFGNRAKAWINYAWAETTDRIADRDVLRLFDQRHTLNLDLDLQAGPHWQLNLSWRFHTGWPTTPLGLRTSVDEEGEVQHDPVLGRLNSRRLPPYHRLDLRASRRIRWRQTEVEIFIDIQNVYNRRNIGGSDYQIDEERGLLLRKPELWPGILPSLGFSLDL